jgi:hypothetical protein
MRRVEADEVEVDDEVVVVVVAVVGLIPQAPSLTFSTRCSEEGEEEEEEGQIASPTMTDRSDAVSSPSLHM